MGIVSKAVEWAVKTANNNSHGYDQANRWGPDYDCSSFVISAYKQAGIALNATYTGNMKNDLTSHGFKIVTGSVNLNTGAGLQAGDVLLNEQNHTAMSLGNGKVVQASVNELGKTTGGKTGDQTGREIYVGWYYNFPWDCVLRYTEKSEASDVKKPSVSEAPKEDAKDGVDYYIVQQGDTLWGIAERFLGNGNLFPLLQQINALGGTTVYPGTMLLLHPEDQDEKSSESEKESAKKGETPETEAPEGTYIVSLKVLKKGMSGDFVQSMQKILMAFGCELPEYGADGDYGTETYNAVVKFQRDNGLPRHGCIDKYTMLKILGV